MSEEPELTRERIHCNTCGLATWHVRVAHHASSWESEEHGVSGGQNLSLMQCCGCETIVTKDVEWFSEDDPEDNRVEFYPPRVSRKLPTWSNSLPKEIARITSEVYNALYANSRTLAVMGARTLIDLVMLDKVGDSGTFGQKLDGLVKEGYISRINREVLEAALEAGNAAAHRGLRPEKDTVDEVIDIVENILQAVYVLEDKAEALRRMTPARPKHGKGKKEK